MTTSSWWNQTLIVAVSLLVAVGTSAPAQEASPPGPRALGDTAADLVYTPVTPCRILDTRLAGGALVPGTPRSFSVTAADLGFQGGNASGCGVPTGATAAMVNFVAVGPAGAGDLRAWPFGQPAPLASILNYAAVTSLNIANGVVVPLCDPATATCTLDLTVLADVGATDLVADVLGFFKSTGSGTFGRTSSNFNGATDLTSSTTLHSTVSTPLTFARPGFALVTVNATDDVVIGCGFCEIAIGVQPQGAVSITELLGTRKTYQCGNLVVGSSGVTDALLPTGTHTLHFLFKSNGGAACQIRQRVINAISAPFRE